SADHGKAYRVDELRLDVEQCGAAAGIDRDLAERAADRGHERKLMLEFDLCRDDRHEAGEVYGDRRADNGGEGALLRDAHVLLRIDVRQFVGEFEAGLPSAAGEREGVARLEIRGKARFVSVEVEQGGHALERLVEIGPVEAAACADIEGAPCGRKCAQRFRILPPSRARQNERAERGNGPISLMM